MCMSLWWFCPQHTWLYMYIHTHIKYSTKITVESHLWICFRFTGTLENNPRPVTTLLFVVILRIEPRASLMLGKHYSIWSMPLAYYNHILQNAFEAMLQESTWCSQEMTCYKAPSRCCKVAILLHANLRTLITGFQCLLRLWWFQKHWVFFALFHFV
jgi:hypothetical protein